MTIKKTLSVTEAAKLCGVGRTNVGYWIRSKKLRVNRVGRNYSIPIDELLFFLKKTGKKIPPELAELDRKGLFFRSYQHCWQFHEGTDHGEQCKDCVAFRNQLSFCFTANKSGSLGCPISCEECRYYIETFRSRIQFIHQIEAPAAVYRDLYFWGGNSRWARLCGVPESDLVGMGVEQIIHPDSLEKVISTAKRWALNDSSLPGEFSLFFKKGKSGKREVFLSVYPLNEPAGTFLLMGGNDG
jgi:excisionase family DNA binding protein